MTDIKYQKDLQKFELNNDGIYSENEITPAQKEASFRLISDVGRNLSVFTGVFIAGIFSIISYIIIWSFEKYRKLKQEEITTHNIGS